LYPKLDTKFAAGRVIATRTVAIEREMKWFDLALRDTLAVVMHGKRPAAIVGLGITPMGKVYGRSATDFAGEAIALALDDAGLEKADVDGLLINANLSPEMQPMLQMSLGFEDLTLLNAMTSYGSTAGTMLHYASLAIQTGRANVVVCVFADAPLVEGGSASKSAYSQAGTATTGLAGLRLAYGDYGPANTGFAFAMRRHMHLYGTTHDHFGRVAVGQREWALMNPHAQMKKPLTIEEYHASRWIVEPLHLFDCCLVSNGGIAVVLTSADRAKDLRRPPVYLRGFGQCATGDAGRIERDPSVESGARISGERALGEAGITLQDIDILELYDCYTYTVIVTLEDYGFCAKGEGGSFIEDGKLAPGGSLPTNTGGGQLSAYYMWSFSPLSEGVIQARGQGGERQVAKNDHVLVSGNGHIMNFHSTMILSKHEAHV
jgi:acetyl-CoA acetyltransferase